MDDYQGGTPQMTANERQIFNQLLYPDDSYNEDGIYWADLPLIQKIKFVSSYDAKEGKREGGNIWKMFKNDPLSPVAYYFRNMVLPGAGLGLEGFVTKALFFFPFSLPLLFFFSFLSFFFFFFFFIFYIIKYKRKKNFCFVVHRRGLIFFSWFFFKKKPTDMSSSPSVT